MLPPCVTCSRLSPHIPSSFTFHGRRQEKKKRKRRRYIEEGDDGEEGMRLCRRSADMKQVSPVNFSTAIPPPSPPFLSIPLFRAFFTSPPPPLFLFPSFILSGSSFLLRCAAGTEKIKKKKKGASDKISTEESPAPHGFHHRQFFHQLHMPRQLYISVCVLWLPA